MLTHVSGKDISMDNELHAMGELSRLLETLEQDQRARVLRWALSRYSSSTLSDETTPDDGAQKAKEAGVNNGDDSFESFADFYHSLRVNDNSSRALAAAYWISTINGGESFQSQALNSLLKDLGFGVSNITDALSANMKENPKLIVQVRKSGSSKQARKSYKITDAGKRRISSMQSGDM